MIPEKLKNMAPINADKFKNILLSIDNSYFAIESDKCNTDDYYNNFIIKNKKEQIDNLFEKLNLKEEKKDSPSLTTIFSFVCGISEKSMTPPTEQEFKEMLQISGYTNEEMKTYVNKNKSILDINFIPNLHLATSVFLITRVLYDAMYDVMSWRNDNEDTEKRSVLKALSNYLFEKKIFQFETDAENYYCNQLAEVIFLLIKRKCILNEDFSSNFMFNTLDVETSLSHDLIVRKKEYANIFSAKVASLRSEEEDIFDNINWNIVCEGFYLSVLHNENLYKTHTGKTFMYLYIYKGGIPIFPLNIKPLEDEDVVFSNEEDADSLIENIYDENDKVNIKFVSPLGDVVDDVNYKIKSFISKYTACYFEDEFGIRKSLIKMLEEGGLSKEKARDIAIIITTLRGKSYNDTFSNKLSNLDFLFKESPSEKKSLVNNVGNGESEIRELKKEISDQKNEYDKKIKQLNKSLKLMMKENKSYRHEIQKIKKENNRLNSTIESYSSERNLEDDNEIVDSVVESDVSNDIVFPYYIEDKKITLFGGFDVFQSELKKYIPDLRIVDLSAHIDLTPIKNSDIVFIQGNKTNHSSYYAIIDACKRADVKYYHLKYSNAKICAEEIVEYIKKVHN